MLVNWLTNEPDEERISRVKADSYVQRKEQVEAEIMKNMRWLIKTVQYPQQSKWKRS